MFKIRCLFVFCSITLAANALPLGKDSEATVLYNNYSIDENGNYRFSFATSNGMAREETGTIVNKGQPNEHIAVKGRYSYMDTEGKQEMVEYSADENGYIILPPKYTGAAFGVPANIVATLLGK
ncbi:endocuticle structural glycoprotein SgAbd-5-like [Bicyclus anynana]|uniref:Endocuticle structural glycoprotein SgAbd-5-like n=1 Tax=Bicyclus anynana TaxID=110368 RepID=A0A6J1NYA4_BICAN|nr:endocuticle structural glycoprotein SgAbd-5-like [Bicyclus anynana]